MRRTEEPAEGIPLKFTFRDGTIKIRRFQVSDEMQVKLLNNQDNVMWSLSNLSTVMLAGQLQRILMLSSAVV